MLRILDVDFIGMLDIVQLFLVRGPDDFSRNAEDQRTRRDFCPLRHDGACADDRVFTDDALVQQNGAHPNDDLVLDRGPVYDRAMSHCNAIPDDGGLAQVHMDEGAVLDIRLFTDFDGGHVASQDCPKPDARVLSDRDLSSKRGVRGNKDRTVDAKSLRKDWN